MKICFVAPDRALRTGSAGFMVRLLRRLGEVEECGVAAGDGSAANDALILFLANSRFDRYVYWRSEAIARRLLPLDLGPTFLAPAADVVLEGDSGAWQRFVNCHFLSFTRAQHQQLRAIGCVSSHFQYFPDPGAAPDRRYDGVRDAFVRWPDRPGDDEAVLSRCRALGIDRLQAHDGREGAAGLTGPAWGHDGPLIERSSWFDRHADYEAAAGQALFFFSPPPTQGIGLACLEAMARGQIAVVPNGPSISDYIAHGCSGLLTQATGLDTGLPILHAGDLRRIGEAARRRAVNGRAAWLADRERLLSIIAADGRRWSTTDGSAGFGNRIRRAARERLVDAR